MLRRRLDGFRNSQESFSKFWLYFSLLWLILTLFSTAEQLVNYSAQGVKYPVIVQIVWNLSNWLPWFFLSPFIFYLTNRLSYKRFNIHSIIVFFLFAGIPVTAVKISLYYLMSLPVRGDITPTFFYTNFRDVLASNFFGNYLVFTLIVLTFYAIHYYRDSRKKELRTYQLETQLTKAQLQVLKMQLQPHFLFNTLNSISALLHQDKEQADTMITKLSDLLRITLDSTDEQLILLDEEVSFLKTYLDIEKIRFQERLQVELNIQEATRSVLVPSLILQPIVENAIKYGVAPFSKLGRVVISSIQNDGFLELCVRDNGPGLAEDANKILNRGIGLRNTKDRLQQLYGSNQKFELTNVSTGGLQVRIVIPMGSVKKEFIDS